MKATLVSKGSYLLENPSVWECDGYRAGFVWKGDTPKRVGDWVDRSGGLRSKNVHLLDAAVEAALDSEIRRRRVKGLWGKGEREPKGRGRK